MYKIFITLSLSLAFVFSYSQNCTPKSNYYPQFNNIEVNAKTSLEDEPFLIKGIAVPSDFPVFEVFIQKNTGPGKLFLANWTGNPYIMILENDGTPFYYQKVEATNLDWKVQKSGVLTRCVLSEPYYYLVMDPHYNAIDTLQCHNGYGTDEHELVIMENGNALLIAIESRIIDMSKLVEGGDTAATVVGNHVQEIDKENNVVFEFICWDNFEITAAQNIDLTAHNIDFVHMNSIAVDFDGNLLVSSRNLSECTKINHESGEIMWRLGGKYNDFEFVNETDTIDYQHDIRPVPGKPNNYTIFDNGNNRGFTRVVEYSIDTVSMTATKVWEYRSSPDKLNRSMGNAQRLGNGNTLINWAAAEYPKATEITPDGEIVYEGNFVTNSAGYRTFRFDWDGYMEEPSLLIEPLAEKTRLIFNMFGDTSVVGYNIYGGTISDSEELIASSSKNWIDLDSLENNKTYFFKVKAVDMHGTESGFSNQESVYTRYPVPGENLVLNSDFAENTNNWGFYLFGGEASVDVNSEEQASLDIVNGGSIIVSVQFRQNGIPLINGYTYVFEFDAVADAPRSIQAKVVQDVSPYTNYSKLDLTFITEEMQTYRYEFKMEDATDLNSRVVFNFGLTDINTRIDNIKLFIKEENIPHSMIAENSEEFSVIAYPNPFNNDLTIDTNIQEPGKGALILTDVAGRIIFRSEIINLPGGEEHLDFNLSGINKGIYFGVFKVGIDEKSLMKMSEFKVIKK